MAKWRDAVRGLFGAKARGGAGDSFVTEIVEDYKESRVKGALQAIKSYQTRATEAQRKNVLTQEQVDHINKECKRYEELIGANEELDNLDGIDRAKAEISQKLGRLNNTIAAAAQVGVQSLGDLTPQVGEVHRGSRTVTFVGLE